MARSRVEVEITGTARDAIGAARDTERAYRGLDGTLDRTGGTAGRTGGKMAGLAAGARRVAVVGAAAGAGLTAAGVGAFKLFTAASDAAEETTAAAEIFGSAFGQIETAADNSARSVGMSSTEYLSAAKTFGVLGNAAGLTTGELAGFSQELITAAADMASFKNATPEEAIAAIGSGLRGEAEPLRRFGILMDDATLRAEALKLGLITTTKDALTPQNKTLAAQSLIMSQLGAAQGDFARTSEGAANQQRILTANAKDLAAQLGESLLPVGEQALTWLNQAVEGFSSLASGAGGTVEPMSASAAAAGLLSGEVEPLTAAVSLGKSALDAFKESMESKARTVKELVTPAIEGFREGTDKVREALARNPQVLEAVKAAAENLAAAFDLGRKATEGVAGVLGDVLGAALSAAGDGIAGLIDLAGALIDAFNAARDAVSSAADSIKRAVGRARDAISNVPLIGRWVGTGGPVLTTAALGRPGLATAAAGYSLPALSVSRTGTSPTAPTFQLVIRVDGALDPVAVAEQIRGIVRDDVRRTGRPWPVSA